MMGTELHEAIGQLIVTAFFFAMQLCEYSTVEGDQRRTVPIHVVLGDMEFRWAGHKLSDSDAASELSKADTAVSVSNLPDAEEW